MFQNGVHLPKMNYIRILSIVSKVLSKDYLYKQVFSMCMLIRFWYWVNSITGQKLTSSQLTLYIQEMNNTKKKCYLQRISQAKPINGTKNLHVFI